MVTCICTLNTVNEEVKVFQVLADHNEKKMLHEFWEYISQIDKPNLVGFNSSSFDIPYIIHRSIVRAEKIPKFYTLDLRKTVNSFFISYESKVKGNLAYWSNVLGIKQSTDSGMMMISYFLRGEYEKIKEHNIEDIKITYELFKRCKEVGIIDDIGERFSKNYDKNN
jgi:uncharacterized protein YprB with RNaseH-like and TPR domain